MKSVLIKHLLLTFLFSLVLTGICYYIWYHSEKRGFEESQALHLLLIIADVFYNIIYLVFSVFVFKLTNPENYKDIITRLICYFSGPVIAALILIIFVAKGNVDRLIPLMAFISFFCIHLLFYFQLIRQKLKLNESVD